jgi:hypothetical protein
MACGDDQQGESTVTSADSKIGGGFHLLYTQGGSRVWMDNMEVQYETGVHVYVCAQRTGVGSIGPAGQEQAQREALESRAEQFGTVYFICVLAR